MIQVKTLPQISVEVNGQRLPDKDAMALHEIRVQQCLSTPAHCILSFHYSPENEIAINVSLGLTVKVFDRNENLVIFEGHVTAVEYGNLGNQKNEIVIRAYDDLHKLRKNSVLKSHVNMTVGDLIEELGSSLGVDFKISEAGPKSPHMIQWGQSHLDFIIEKSFEAGLYFVINDKNLHLFSLKGLEISEEIVLGDSLLESRVELNADQSCRQVEVKAWNPWKAESIEANAKSARSGRGISAEASPSNIGGSGKVQLTNATMQTPLQAEAYAQGYQDLKDMSEVRFSALLQGNAKLFPGVCVNTQGLPSAIEGKYLLSRVTHVINAEQGYVCEVDTLPPQAQKTSNSNNSTTLGVVTRVDDPSKLGRLKAKLPAYGDVETEWMEVCMPAVGANKGFVALPDVDDNVLVLMMNQNPSQAVVMGVLYGTKKPIDDGVSGNSVKRYTLSTPGGQKLVLNDDKNILRLENSSGSFVEMSPGKVTVSSKTQLLIEAPGNTITIKASKVDFKQG